MYSVTIQPSGQQFQVEDGEAVLAAALRQGFVLPYSCKNGVCGSCKGKILAGTVDYGVYQQKTLTDEEVNVIMEKVTAALNNKDGWQVR